MKKNQFFKIIFFTTILILGIIIIKNNSLSSFPDKEFFIETYYSDVDGDEKEAGDKVSLKLEVADTQEERNLGLMNRENLREGLDGMLFVFDKDVSSGFWMKDTYIPLSIAFLDSSGKIQEIIKMDVCQSNEECPVYFPKEKYRYAIEVKEGFFQENGITPGDKVLGLQ